MMTKRTDDELAAEMEARIDAMPTPAQGRDSSDLRRVADAREAADSAAADLLAAVDAARANGRSWAEIGMMLDVSRQAARERFAVAKSTPRRRPRKSTAA